MTQAISERANTVGRESAASRSQSPHLHRLATFVPGAVVEPYGVVCFRLWAPTHERISVAIEGLPEPIPALGLGDGWFELRTPAAQAGSRYKFILPDGTQLPDPASRFQPDGVHGSSEVIDLDAYTWRATQWRGRPWHEAVVYELHIGTFTPEGTFKSAIERLDYLVSL